jgi:type I restriction enzyme M protein
MNNKKEQERDELHKTIWKIANELRGSVDGWDFKQYVLGLLFYRFISENIENYVNGNQIKAGQVNFKYSDLSDEDALNGKSQILEEKGFFILPSELFCNVRKNAKNNENLNVVIANIFDNIESSARGTASEDDVKGLFDDFDVKGNKLGNTVEERNNKLVKMIDAIGDLKLGDYQDNSIDTFGDAYEFLMTMYASNAGKSGGEFFTPQEVGELLARICIGDKTSVNKVYDPCCGSGGLLLKFAKILGKENVKQGFFGQEVNLTTYNLARINMFLHDINYNNFNLSREDTLIHPEHWDDEPFDAIVSNPPYSIHWQGKSNPILINDERFAPAGVLAPESKADLAFTMHMLSWLSPKGTAAIVEFPGVLYRGGAEQKIRKYMIDNNFVDTIIQLPSDLFFGTSIATCILVLKKNKTDNNILFVDASEECVRNTNKNKLSQDNIDNIVNLLKNRKSIEYKSYLATYEEVKENDYNISVNSYLKTNTSDHEIDIKEVNRKLAEIVPREEQIRKELEEIIRDLESDYHE